MPACSGLARWGAMVILVAAASAACAQTMYRCRSGGSTVISPQPCTTGAGSHIDVIGPQESRYSTPEFQSTYTPGVTKAPEHLSYLSAECATLNDAIRTAPARGLRGAAISDLHNEYRSKCAEEESEARQRVYREQSDQRNARKSEQQSQKFQRELGVRERDQCHELLRILHGKRQRLASMSDGEKTDLANSEAAYHARCSAR